MKGIDPEVAVHRLNIKLDTKPIKKKRRHFDEQENVMIEKEVEKLLKIGHIERIHVITWLFDCMVYDELNYFVAIYDM